MKFVFSVILFLGAVAAFTALSGFNHREAVEKELQRESVKVLQNAGFKDVSVSFDHLKARLGGFVDSEEDKRHVLALIDDDVPGAYVPSLKEVGIRIRPSIVPEIRMTKKAGLRVASLEGKLAVDASADLKYLGTSLYVINGVDAVENDLNLDPQYLPFDAATEFAALAAGLIPASDYSEIVYSEKGVTIAGLVENEGVKSELLALAEKLAPGKVVDKLTVKSRSSGVIPAEFHLVRSRFGLTVSGQVKNLDAKSKIFEVLASAHGSSIGDNLDIQSHTGEALWLDEAAKIIPLFVANVKGDAEIHFNDHEVKVAGSLESDSVREEIAAVLAGLKKKFPDMKIVSSLDVNETAKGKNDSGDGVDIGMVFDPGKISIAGKIDSEASKNIFTESVIKKSPKTEFINDLRVNPKATYDAWMNELPMLFSEVIKRVSSGSLRIKDHQLVITGTTHGVEEKQLIQNVAVNLLPDDYKVVNRLVYTDQPFPAPDLHPEATLLLVESLKGLPVYFDKNSDALKKDQVKQVEKAARAIQRAGGNHPLVVGGFADSVGNADYNRELSIRRAMAVKNKLIALGIKAERLKIKSFSENASSAPRSERWKSRRVEISLEKKG